MTIEQENTIDHPFVLRQFLHNTASRRISPLEAIHYVFIEMYMSFLIFMNISCSVIDTHLIVS